MLLLPISKKRNIKKPKKKIWFLTSSFGDAQKTETRLPRSKKCHRLALAGRVWKPQGRSTDAAAFILRVWKPVCVSIVSVMYTDVYLLLARGYPLFTNMKYVRILMLDSQGFMSAGHCIHPTRLRTRGHYSCVWLKWEQTQQDQLYYRKGQNSSQSKNKTSHRQCRCSLGH